MATPPDPISILLAEDNPVLREGLETALISHGYSVIAVEDGQSALESLEREGHPDLLVLDVRMPRLSGLELLERVRARPATAHLPVILITALEREAIPVADRNGEEIFVLRKPFHLEELVRSIEALREAARERAEPGALVARAS